MSSMPGKPTLLAKPTLDTRFHIDYDWWKRTEGEDLRIYLISHLPPEERDRFTHASDVDQTVDFIDPETGEVVKLDALGVALRRAAQAPDFLTGASVVDAVFRVFVRNNNTPLSVKDIADLIERDAKTVLDLLRRNRYKGISPLLEG